MSATSDYRTDALGARLRDSARSAVDEISSIKILEFALFFLLIAHSVLPLPSIGFPISNLIMAAVVGLAVFRRPTFELRSNQWIIPVFALGLFYVATLSVFQEPTELAADWQGRVIRLTVTFAFAMVIASGRIDLRSGLWGFVLALVVNVPLFLAGLLPAPYGEYLTGMIGDKNVAGLIYAVAGVLVLYLVRNPWFKYGLFSFLAYSVWLTGSRTSIAALGAAIVWSLAAPHLKALGRVLLAIAIYWLVELLQEDYSQIGAFSDREGSDLLRERIDAASEIKVQDAGFFGSGLGEAYITFTDEPYRVWFFHNSYWTLLVEGGWIWAAVIVGLTVAVMVRPWKSELTHGQIIGQALGLVLLLCALRLGEVFLTLSWAIAIGFALQVHSSPKVRSAPGADVTDRQKGLSDGYSQATA